jgi:hypothetical protein
LIGEIQRSRRRGQSRCSTYRQIHLESNLSLGSRDKDISYVSRKSPRQARRRSRPH